MAMLVAQLSTATAAFTWMMIEWVKAGKPSALGIVTGAVAGLVAITPASGTCGPMGAIAMGFVAGGVCYISATSMKRAFGYDDSLDSLDAFGVDGIGGIVGALLTGVFASPSLEGAGLSEGFTITTQVISQAKSVLFTIAYSGILSFIILKGIDVIIGLHVDEEQEHQGLDITQHNEEGYLL